MCQVVTVESLSPRAQLVQSYLAHWASSTDPARPFTGRIAYSKLCTTLDPQRQYWVPRRYKGIGPVLAEVGSYEHAHGRPILPALVVRKHSGRPGRGFADLARSLGEEVTPGQEVEFWRAEVERVISYWASLEPRD